MMALEAQTIAKADWQVGTVPSKTQYLRDVGAVIGWDDGDDASLSYVECTGQSARSYHGRPIGEKNPLVGKLRRRAGG